MISQNYLRNLLKCILYGKDCDKKGASAMFLRIGMLKPNYFLTDFFILLAEKYPIKLAWQKNGRLTSYSIDKQWVRSIGDLR